MLDDREQGINQPPTYVPASTLYGFAQNTIVGSLALRHRLNQHLRVWGGHIGYFVLEPYRSRGYATSMLKQSLAFARKLGLDKVMLTCDSSNLASIKVIERSGGIFEEQYQTNSMAEPKNRYWITVP